MGEVVHWNVRRAPRALRRLPSRTHRFVDRLENNAGDLLGPVVVGLLLDRAGIDRATPPSRRLLAIGSIMHLAQSRDVIWGAGRNGRVDESHHRTSELDVRAVRGPLTREWLLERGIACPPVFGDPALLLPMLRPDLCELGRRKRHRVTFVRHIDDRPTRPVRGVRSMSARTEIERWLRTIVQSRLVVSTSLHAVIVAEAFGVPAVAVVNRTETEFKFTDYYAATGRPSVRRTGSVAEAIRCGGAPSMTFDPEPLLAAFPWDLFGAAATGSSAR